MIGKERIQIPKKVIDKVINWNKEKRHDVLVDKKIFGSLILCLVKPEQLAKGNFNKYVLNFIRGET